MKSDVSTHKWWFLKVTPQNLGVRKAFGECPMGLRSQQNGQRTKLLPWILDEIGNAVIQDGQIANDFPDGG
jgi:hypothetical protein